MYFNFYARRFAFVMTLIVLFGQALSAQTIYYVNIGSGNDANSGTSWSNAYQNLTKALASANTSTASEVQIWVAQGAYTPIDGVSVLPSNHSDTSFTFYRGNGIGKALKVYGGFVGTESSISARDTTHISYLDGVIGSINSYHVGVIAGLSPTADSVIIDGFTFNNGLAKGTTTKNFNGISTDQNTGGGLLLKNDSTTKLLVKNCTFSYNTALGKNNNGVSYTGGDGFGGGMYSYQAKCNLEKCKFIGNFAFGNIGGGGSMSGIGFGGKGLGGAIYNESGILAINGCTFTSNQADGGVGYSGSGYGGGVGGNGTGGAIYFINTTGSSVRNSTFNTNAALTGYGGSSGGIALSYGGAVFNSSSNVQFLKCTFNSNKSGDSTFYGTSKNYAGAVANFYFSGRFDSCQFISNTNFRYSHLSTYGGAIYNYSSPDTFKNCIINDNSSYNGDAIMNDASSTVFDYCTLDHNNYSGSGAGASVIYNKNNSHTIISNCKITYSGAGIENDTSTLTMVNDTVGVLYYNTSAVVSIGAITNITSCYLYSNPSAIYNNSSILNVKKSTIRWSTHGGIISTKSNPFIDSCIFDNNTNYGSGYGGGVYVMDSTITIKHTIFSNNSAYYYEGGAIYVANSGNSSFKSDGNVFLNNYAPKGGAISIGICSTCADTLLNNIFIGNKSTGTGTTKGGGAILVNGSRNYIYNNTFMNDTAVGYGGAIRLEGTGGLVKVANNIFYKSAGTSTSADTSVAGSGTFLFSNNIFTGTNPQFRDSTNPIGSDGIWGTADDGLKLKSCSPGVNAGSNAYIVAGEIIDITGSTRNAEGTVDIGAYESNTIGAITGPSTLCLGSTTTFSDTSAGGTWVSSNTTTATVSTTGVVRALSTGTTTLSYTASSSCGGSVTATLFVTVERAVSAISGADTICRGTTTTLTDSVASGTWTSSNPAIASVSVTGLVTAIAAGLDTITYSLTNSCGTTTSSKTILIQRRASAIAGGTDTFCRGSVIAYSDSAVGGTWTTSNSVVATINTSGSLTARAAGTDSVIYTLTNICGTSSTYKEITVERQPSVIVTNDSLCLGTGYTTPIDSVSGGIWRLSNITVFGLYDSITGTHYPINPGRDTLSYRVTNSCGTYTVSKVLTCVGYGMGVITGLDTVCVGASIVLSDTSYSGGFWSSNDTTIATINVTGHVTGVSGSTVTITYSTTNACGYNYITSNIFVNTPPVPVISGSSIVCTGASTTLSGSPTGGTWTVTNSNATVGASSGVVNGVTAGNDSVIYAVANACGTGSSAYPITIITVPPAATISGPDTVCEGHTLGIFASIGGGTWSASNGNATISGSGVVTGVTAGTVTFTYTLSNSCGNTTSTYPFTVHSAGYCDSATSVKTPSDNQQQLVVYPNPTQGSVTLLLQSNTIETVTIKVTNILGEQVKEWSIVTNKTEDKNLGLPAGVYLLTATTDSRKYVVRLVVE